MRTEQQTDRLFVVVMFVVMATGVALIPFGYQTSSVVLNWCYGLMLVGVGVWGLWRRHRYLHRS